MHRSISRLFVSVIQNTNHLNLFSSFGKRREMGKRFFLFIHQIKHITTTLPTTKEVSYLPSPHDPLLSFITHGVKQITTLSTQSSILVSITICSSSSFSLHHQSLLPKTPPSQQIPCCACCYLVNPILFPVSIEHLLCFD